MPQCGKAIADPLHESSFLPRRPASPASDLCDESGGRQRSHGGRDAQQLICQFGQIGRFVRSHPALHEQIWCKGAGFGEGHARTDTGREHRWHGTLHPEGAALFLYEYDALIDGPATTLEAEGREPSDKVPEHASSLSVLAGRWWTTSGHKVSGLSPGAALLAGCVAFVGALLVARWIWERLAPPVVPPAARIYVSWDRSGRAARDRLLAALAPAVAAGTVVVHHDREVRRGEAWDQRMNPRVYDADLYVVLLTPGWLRDPLCRGRERPIWEPRVTRREARVLLVHLHATALRDPALLRLPLHPTDGRPLSRPGQRLPDPAWVSVADAILAAAGRG